MKEFIHGGNIYKEKAPGGEWLDFSANINPLGIAAGVREAITNGIEGLVNYPDPDGSSAKAAIADYYGVPADKVILGNGAAELLYIFFHTRQPKNLLLPVPSFSEYERAAKAGRTEIVYHELNAADGFRLDVEKFIKSLRFMDCAVIGNPNNPTGTLLEREELVKIISAAKNTGTTIIVDESFIDFRTDAAEHSARSLLSDYDNLLLLQSLTKFYALPGLRLGFALTSTALREQMELQKDTWNMNYLAQQAVVAALADKEYQEKSRLTVKNEQKYLMTEFDKLSGVKLFIPTVNFILLDIKKTGLTSAELTSKMKEKGILIRDCSNYPGIDNSYIRVAIKRRADNICLINAFKEILR